jgi:hypothetical protein
MATAAEVGLPNALVTQDIVCQTINGQPFVPGGGGGNPQYCRILSLQPVGPPFPAAIPMTAFEISTSDFTLNTPNTVQFGAASVPGVFVFRASIGLTTPAGGFGRTALQLRKNNVLVPNSKEFYIVQEQNCETIADYTRLITLAPGDVLQLTLELITDPQITSVVHTAVAGPPAIAAQPNTIEIYRYII